MIDVAAAAPERHVYVGDFFVPKAVYVIHFSVVVDVPDVIVVYGRWCARAAGALGFKTGHSTANK
jgi:hypothetical protein